MSGSPTPGSTTPLRDYLDGGVPGTTPEYVVVPRSLAQSMPLRWQQQFTGLLAELHDAFAHLPWPENRVVPSRWARLRDLAEEPLAAAGYIAELSSDGELEYRDSSGERVADPSALRVLAPVDDPLPKVADGRVEPRPAPPL